MAQDPGLDSGMPVDINGTISVQQDSTVQGEFSNTCTPSQDFAFYWNGCIVNFYANISVPVGAAMLAALQAQGAPISTP